MARFPFRSETAAEEGHPRVVDLEGEDADAVFSALSSTTARRIYARLDEEQGTRATSPTRSTRRSRTFATTSRISRARVSSRWSTPGTPRVATR